MSVPPIVPFFFPFVALMFALLGAGAPSFLVMAAGFAFGIWAGRLDPIPVHPKVLGLVFGLALSLFVSFVLAVVS